MTTFQNKSKFEIIYYSIIGKILFPIFIAMIIYFKDKYESKDEFYVPLLLVMIIVFFIIDILETFLRIRYRRNMIIIDDNSILLKILNSEERIMVCNIEEVRFLFILQAIIFKTETERKKFNLLALKKPQDAVNEIIEICLDKHIIFKSFL